MAFADCIKSALDQKEITDQDAARLKGLYDSLLRQHAQDGAASAPHAAREALAKMIEAEGQEAKRQHLLTLKASLARWKDLKEFRAARLTRDGVQIAGKTTADIAEAAIRTLEHQGNASFQNVQGLKMALVGQAHGRMEGLLHEFRRSAVGGDKFRHGKARLDNVVDEAFGHGTGDEAAKGLAQAWAETAEWLRRLYNDAGGHIAKLDNWGLPQLHSAEALRNAGRAVWKKTIAPLLDSNRMVHPLTGNRVTPEDLDQVLEHVFDAVTQEGWASREASRQRFGMGALANQNAEHRFLVFKDGASWRAYQQAFGEGDAFAAMMAYVNRMSRDIAAMQILGPNPTGTLEWMKQLIEKEGQKAASGKPHLLPHDGAAGLDYARTKIDVLERMWASMRGELETPVNSWIADTFAATRNFIVSTVMGAATLSSVSDVGTQILARNHAGIPSANLVQSIAHGFTTLGKREAVEADLVLDAAMHSFHQQARYVGTFSGPEWSQYLADRVLTWSGLTPWTQAGRHAFGLDFMRHVARTREIAFQDLDPAWRQTFSRWGFSSDDWDTLRRVPVHDAGGLPLVRARDIAAIDQTLANQYLGMINGEMEYAVPTGSTRSSVFIKSADKRGTLWGEISRSGSMFKSFPTTFLMLNVMRVMPLIASGDGALKARGAKYAGGLLLSTTLFGALSIQLKQVAAGRDPRSMNDRRFWGAAVLQGGGLGIFGDFLFSDVNRYGGGLPSTLSGPMVQHLWDLWTLTGGNSIEVLQGKDTHFGRELVKAIGSNTPGGSLWYGKLAYERIFLDQLQYLVDPKANAAFKAKRQWWKRETGQDYWWQPGDLRPARAPDLAAAAR
jgi:hypothetical protein